MSHVTADLEYFKCDVCGVYFHKNIFCDHRRDCTGLNSDALKKSECRTLQEALSRDTRWLLENRMVDGDAAPTADRVRDDSRANAPDSRKPALLEATAVAYTSHGVEGVSKSVYPLTTEEDRRVQSRVRSQVANKYHAKQDAAFQAKLSDAKRKQLMDLLSCDTL